MRVCDRFAENKICILFFGLSFALYIMKKKITLKKRNCYEKDQSFKFKMSGIKKK